MAAPAAVVVMYLGLEVATPEIQLAQYKQQLAAHHVTSQVTFPALSVVLPADNVGVAVPTPYQFYPATTLTCLKPTQFDWGMGLAKQGDADIWQYKLLMSADRSGRPVSAKKPKSYRIGFLLHPNFGDSSDDYPVSHLCHHNFCHNPAHLVLESLALNKSRNGCPGGAFCQHQTKCLRPGPYYQS